MAEYKTYTCDICGEQQAMHFIFPSVDQSPDPADGRMDDHPGYVDLCAKHAQRLVNVAVKELGVKTADQRKWWKACLDKAVRG